MSRHTLSPLTHHDAEDDSVDHDHDEDEQLEVDVLDQPVRPQPQRRAVNILTTDSNGG